MSATLRPLVDLDARCACGAVRVRISGEVGAMFMCACEDCQRASGAGRSAVFLVSAGDATIDGETGSFATTAASGATFTRRFCPVCGTPICGVSGRRPDAVLLPVGLFGAAAAGWYRPRRLIFARSHRHWDAVAAELPRHDTYPAATRG